MLAAKLYDMDVLEKVNANVMLTPFLGHGSEVFVCQN